MEIPAIKFALLQVGGEKALAQKLGVTRQAVQYWVRINRVPADRLIAVEEATGVSREDLRPDLYRSPKSEGNPATSVSDANSAVEKAAVPDGLDLAVWDRWLVYRKKIGKNLKPVSIPAAQRKLAAFGSAQAAVVEQSIANGWQGLFALKTTVTEHKTKFDKAMEHLHRE